MNVNMKMPDLSATEGSEIKILKWLVEVDASVERGQIILEVETDKAVQEIECFVAGRLSAKHVEANDLVAVGQLIATIEVRK